MNKIYRVIWCNARNCYVVVSEIAKVHSKGGLTVRRSSTVGTVLITMLMASVLNIGISAPVWAEPPATGANYYGVNATDTTATNVNGEGATGAHAIAAGENAKATGEKAISIGYGANANNIENIVEFPTVIPNELYKNIRKFDDFGNPDGTYYDKNSWKNLNDEQKKAALLAELRYRWQEGGEASIAIGDMTFSLKGDVVIGSNAKALGNDAVVIGLGATGFDNSVALGTNSSAAPTAIAIGSEYVIADDNNASKAAAKATANYSIAVGMDTAATQTSALAIGTGAKAGGIYSTSLGSDAKAMALNAIALGRDSAAGFEGSNKNLNQIAIGNKALSKASNTITIGNEANNNTSFPTTALRQVQSNKIRKEGGGTWSSSAWGELNDTQKSNALKYELTLRKNERDNATDATLYDKYRNSITIGEGTNSLGLQNVTIGSNAMAAGERAISIGRTTRALETDSIAIGYLAATSAAETVAIGANSFAGGANSIAVGEGAQTFKQNTVSVGNGAKAYGYQSSVVGFHSYSIGNESTVFGHDSTAHGTASAVFGYNSSAGTVTLVNGDATLNYEDAWSRVRVVREKGEDEQGNTIYERTGKLSSDKDHPTEYEIVTTKSGKVVAMKRVTAENTDNNAVPEYYKIKEFRTVDNLLDENGRRMSDADRAGYWFVVDTSSTGKISNIKSSDYGGQTEGGVAFGDLANAVGDKSLAVGRSTVADGNDSTAVGIFANAYGSGSMAYGQFTSAGTVNLISSEGDSHITNMKTVSDNASVSVYRRLVNGESALLNKLNEYVLKEIKDSKGITVNSVPIKMNAAGQVLAYWTGGDVTSDEAYLDPDKWTSVSNVLIKDDITSKVLTKDNDSNRYYYTQNNEKIYISDTDIVRLAVNGVSMKVPAGSLMLSEGGLAMGAYAHAEGDKSLAVGRTAGAYDKNSAAVGQFANALGEDSLAIGHNASAGAQVTLDPKTQTATVTLLNGSPVTSGGANGIAIGSYSHAVGDKAIAIGRGNIATGDNAIAFGSSASASVADAVALGSNTVANTDAGIATETSGYDPATREQSTKTDATWRSTAAAVSVGGGELTTVDDEGNETTSKITRQITNVAAGTEDTDAVNVAQLKQVAASTAEIHDYSVNSVNSETDLNYDGEGATGNDALAAGVSAIAKGANATAVGKDSLAEKDFTVAVGNAAHATSDYAIALGNETQATKNNAVAIGSSAQANHENSVAIGANSQTADKVGTASYTINGTTYNFAGATPVGTVSVGAKNEEATIERTITNVAAGRISAESTDAINGSQLYAVSTEASKHNTVKAGTNVTVVPNENASGGIEYTVSATHNKLTGVNVTQATSSDDTMTAVLKDLDNNDTTISLKNTYTTVTKSNNTVTFSRNDGVEETISLSDLGASDYAIEAQTVTVDSDGKVTLKASDRMNPDATYDVVIEDLATKTQQDINTENISTNTTNIAKNRTDLDAGWNAKVGESSINVNPENNDLTFAAADDHVTVTADGRTIKVGVNGLADEDLSNITGAGEKVITDIARESITVEGKDGIEVTQSEDKSKYTVRTKLSDNLTLREGNIDLANKLKIGNGMDVHTVTIDGEAGEVTGLTNTTWSKDGTYNAGRAATEEQLKDVYEAAKDDAVDSVKLKFQGENTDTTLVRGNDEVLQIVGDGTNITVKGENDKLNVQLSKNLQVDSITAGDTVINADGVTAKSVTADKVTVGDTVIEDKKITMGDTVITDSSVTTSEVKAGNTTINDSGVTTNQVTVGDTAINSDGLTIADGPSVTIDGIDAGSNKITNVANGTEDSDAVNLAQLKEAATASKTVVEGGTNIASVTERTGDEGQSIYTVNADGASVSEGSDAVKVTKGAKDANNVTDYAVDLSVKTKATLDKVENEGLTFAGDTGTSNKIKLGDKLNLKGGATGAFSDGNIGVDAEGGTLNIKLAKDIKDVDSIQVSKTVKIGDNITLDGDKTTIDVGGTNIADRKITMGDTSITSDSITANSVRTKEVKAGDSTLNSEGLTITDGPSVTKDGINAGGNRVTNMADGEEDSDAASMGQLRNLAENTGTAISNVSNQISEVDNRMKKGLAGAAALAALHPMDFDPDSKLTFAAGVGNYRGANAGAIGAFYRPDEKIMFSMGGTFGNGENMVNAGVSFALDRVNRVTTSRIAMAKEIVELRDHIAKQDDQIAKLTALVNKLVGPEQAISNPSMFPDVPENQWAYEYVANLQRSGALKGYPGGLSKGDRAMTRYEFAAMLDRAMQNGIKLDERAAKEFEPELGRIYVQRVSG